jgi:hypothetical protein
MLILVLIEDLGVKFNFDINELTEEDLIFTNSLYLKYEGYKVLEIDNEFIRKGILKELEDIVKDLEKMNMDENQEFRLLYYSKEVADKDYEEYTEQQKKKKEE